MPKKTKKGKKEGDKRPILKLNIRSRSTRDQWHRVVNAERKKQGLTPHPDGHYYAYSFIKVLKAKVFRGMSHKDFKKIVQKYKSMHTGEEFVRLMMSCKMHEDESSRDNKINLLKQMIEAVNGKTPVRVLAFVCVYVYVFGICLCVCVTCLAFVCVFVYVFGICLCVCVLCFSFVCVFV